MPQPTMFPITQEEFEGAAFRIAELMEVRSNALEDFDQAKADHKEHLKKIDQEMAECKRKIRLMREQRKGTPVSGVTRVLEAVTDQVNAGALDREGVEVSASMTQGR